MFVPVLAAVELLATPVQKHTGLSGQVDCHRLLHYSGTREL